MSMNKIILISFIFFFILGCEPDTTRVLKPYDPDKAGATIVESFDITDDFVKNKKDRNYDLFEYNENICVHIEGVIYFFDKENFIMKNVININFPKIGYSDDEYYDIKNMGRQYYDPENFRYFSQGMTVTGDKALLLTFWPAPYYLFSVDLTNGNAVLLDTREDIKGKSSLSLVGYDKKRELVWFRIVNSENNYSPYYRFHFYEYDEDNYTFISRKTKDAPYVVGRNNRFANWHAVIYGEKIWYTGFAADQISSHCEGKIVDVGLDRRTLDEPSVSLQFIDVEYLGTLSLPTSFIYDPPYIWIMVERNNRIEMLKLLPHG
jgi:hypothetical protein